MEGFIKASTNPQFGKCFTDGGNSLLMLLARCIDSHKDQCKGKILKYKKNPCGTYGFGDISCILEYLHPGVCHKKTLNQRGVHGRYS